MSLLVQLAIFYGISVIFIAGMLIGDEMAFKNPEYGKVLLGAVFWLPIVLFALLRRLTQR